MKKIPASSTTGLLVAFLGGCLVTGVSFLIDCGFGVFFHKGLSACDAGTKGVGFLITLIIGGTTLFFLASVVRSWILALLVPQASKS
jgi:hypothetical protein